MFEKVKKCVISLEKCALISWVRSVQSYILHITGSYKKDRVCSVIDMSLICW